jgi:O-antigen/teichoic acid export membrane protein
MLGSSYWRPIIQHNLRDKAPRASDWVDTQHYDSNHPEPRTLAITDSFKDSERNLLGGAFSLTLCTFISQVINYAIQIGLGRFFAPAAYAYFAIIASTFSIIETVLRWGLGRTVAFYVAQDRKGAKQVLKKSLQLQTVYALTCFFVFLFLADRVAAVLGDPGLSSYLRWAAFFILTFAFVPVYSGFLNGTGAFREQGAIPVIRSLAKLVFIVVFLAAGMEMYGVIVAYTAGELLATAYGIWASHPYQSAQKERVQAKNIIAFGFPLFMSALAGSLLMRMDLFMIQSLLSDRVLTGFYASAAALIKAPYFLSHGTGLVVFRRVAQLQAQRPAEVCGFISRTSYYYILALAPVPFILSASAEQILGLAFGRTYLAAAPVFKILVFCFAFMVLQDVAASLIAALARPRLNMIFSLGLLPLQLFLIYAWISTGGLAGAALATTVSWALGAVVGAIYLLVRGYLVLPKWTTFLKVGIASISSYYVALWGCPSSPWLLAFCPLVFLFYLGLLKLMGEFNNGEIRVLLASFLPAKTQSQRA